MSRVVELHIGPKTISWDYSFPDVLGLLFESENYETKYNEAEGWREHSYVTTCGDAVDKLNKHNITLNKLRRHYFLYYRFRMSRYRLIIQSKCESYLSAKYEEPVESSFVNGMVNHIFGLYFHQLDVDQEYERVMECFRNWVLQADEPRKTPSYEPQPGPSGKLIFKKEDFFRHNLAEFLREDPYSPWLGEDWIRSSGLNDFDDLYYLITPIFACDPDVSIKLDVTELIDSAEELRPEAIGMDVAQARLMLLLRYQEASEVFEGISGILIASRENKTINVSTLDIIAVAEKLKVKVKEPLTAKEKGDILEDLADILFSGQQGFEVKKKVRGRTDELDLVVKNSINDPFWISLHSPYILVECKNWKDPVRVEHIWNLETKIKKRKGFCSLGVVIAPGGFTSKSYEDASSAGRVGLKIILVNNAALKKRSEENMTTADWLEMLMLEQY
jgi:hypothetical protein